MIAAERIDTIVANAAKRTLGPRRVTRTYSEPTVDSEGEDALRVTIVLAPKAVDVALDPAVSANEVVSLLV